MKCMYHLIDGFLTGFAKKAVAEGQSFLSFIEATCLPCVATRDGGGRDPGG